MRLTTHYHHTRYEENGSEGKFSLRMPRRKSSVFKPPVLIQFQVTADTQAHPSTAKGAKRPRREGSHGLPAALALLVTPSKPAVRTHRPRVSSRQPVAPSPALSSSHPRGLWPRRHAKEQ